MLRAEYIAKAVFDAVSTQKDVDVKKIVKNLISYLNKKGAIKLLPKVLKELSKIEKEYIQKKQVLKIARKQDLNYAIKELNISSDDVRDLNIVFDNTLIGGYIYKKGGKVILNDYKHHLLDLYEKIISRI